MLKPQIRLRTLFFLVTYSALLCGWAKLLAWWQSDSWMWCFYPWNLKAKLAVVCYLVGYASLLFPRSLRYAWQWGELGAFLLVLDYVYETSYEGWNNPFSPLGGAQFYFNWGFADGISNLTQFIVLTIPLAYYALWQGRSTQRIPSWSIFSLVLCIINASLIFGMIDLFHRWKYLR